MEVAKELLKGKFIDSIEEYYTKELHQGYSKCNKRSLFKLMEHVDTQYAFLDTHALGDIMTRFKEPPDLAVLIEVYLKK